MVLFVGEATSISRQLGRGREIAEHNTKVAETGIGKAIELRATDLSEYLVRRRYQVFKEQTWTALPRCASSITTTSSTPRGRLPRCRPTSSRS